MLTHSKVSMNLKFIVGVFCKTSMVNCAVSSQAGTAHYV